MKLVSATEHISNYKTPSWEREHNCRWTIQGNEGPLWLDVESPCFQADTSANGSTADGLVCILFDKTTTEILQLETRSRGEKYGRLQPGLVRGFANPHSSLVESNKAAKGQSSDDHTTLDHSTMVSIDSRNVGGLPTPLFGNPRFGNIINNPRCLHNETRGTRSSLSQGTFYITRNFCRSFRPPLVFLENKIQLQLTVYQMDQLVSAKG